MKDLNYAEVRTILEENGYEPDSVVDIAINGENNYVVLFIEASITKIVTIKERKCIPWEINKYR